MSVLALLREDLSWPRVEGEQRLRERVEEGRQGTQGGCRMCRGWRMRDIRVCYKERSCACDRFVLRGGGRYVEGRGTHSFYESVSQNRSKRREAANLH